MKIVKGLLSLFVFCVQSLHAFEPDADLVLLLPAMTENERASLQAEAEDWINNRQATRGHTVQTITLKEVADYAGRTQSADILPEDIRNYLRDHFTHSRYTDYPHGRYLGLLSYAPNGVIYDEYASTSGEHEAVIQSQDYTIEFFFQLRDVQGQHTFFYNYDQETWSGFYIRMSDGNLQLADNSLIHFFDINEMLDTGWHHMAIVVHGEGDGYIYLDGHELATYSHSANPSLAHPLLIGGSRHYFYPEKMDYLLNGAIDEVRISSVARYSGDFVVPTEPFTVDSATRALYHFDETSGDQYADASGHSFDLVGYGQPSSGTSVSPSFGSCFLTEGFYGDEAAAYAGIPRHNVCVNSEESEWVPTDMLYGYLAPAEVQNEDGTIAAELINPSFLVFRMPVRQEGQLSFFMDKALQYEAAPYNRDLTLVAGRFQVYGDTEMVQCLNASKVKNVNNLFKVFDDPLCSPTFVTTDENHRLFQFMQSDTVSGGMYYNISHGSVDSINASETENLRMSDVASLSPDKLDIFVSLACDNDGDSDAGNPINKNLANTLMEHQSAAVVSSTETLYPQNLADIRIGELQFLQQFYDKPNTLLQAIQTIRDKYYRYYSRQPSDTHYLINLLALNVLGDGLIRLPQPTASRMSVESQTSLTALRPTVYFTIWDGASEEGGDYGYFRIYRGENAPRALTVNYTMSGTASNGVDYTALSGSVTMPAGVTATSITFYAINDDDYENVSETVTMTLDANPRYIVGSPASVTTTIKDTDPDPDKSTISITSVDHANEPSNGGWFRLYRVGGDLEQELPYTYVISGTASNGVDYGRLSGTNKFSAAAVDSYILVSVIDDRLYEGGESVIVTLQPSSSYHLGSTVSDVVAIYSDDSPPSARK